MKLICGIDEAGRGAVLGPLVVAGVCLPEEQLFLLERLGVKDSKLLKHPVRERIMAELDRHGVAFFYSLLLPAEIDAVSINALEIREAITIINNLAPHEVYIDVPSRGRGIDYYCQKIKRGVAPGVIINGGNKFDTLHRVVGAASIVAKVMRERSIEELKLHYGNFGSGYPNKRTVLYIQEHYDKIKPIARMKWSTIAKIKNKI